MEIEAETNRPVLWTGAYLYQLCFRQVLLCLRRPT